MMRQTITFAAPRQVTIEESALPSLQPHELLVQTIVSGISAGTELLFYRGQVPPDLAVDSSINALAGAVQYPLAYGYAAVGRVVECGTAADPAWRDRLVFAFQPHTSHFLAVPDDLLPLPADMLPETAVFLPNMETAVSFVMDGRPVLGEQLVIFGQGIVGLLTTGLLAQMSPAALVAVETIPQRQQWAREQGATAVINPTHPQAIPHIQAALPAGSADLTLELSGNPAALEMALTITGYAGRILIGSWYGQKPVSLPLGGAFHRSHIQMISSQVSTLHPRWHGRWSKTRRLQTAWQMLARHQPQTLITHRLPLAQAPHAYHLLDTAPKTTGQIVFSY
jgi:2-desacetyl-2-hydroxyethyl bacteriochlorophyllide A dehydrogenase